MTLYEDLKGFLRKYMSNPLVVAAAAYLAYKMIKKHLPKKEEAEKEAVQILKRVGDKELVKDLETGKTFWAGTDEFQIVENYREKLARVREEVKQRYEIPPTM